MTDNDAFLQTLIENPDDGLRLVYADWLEEHDDPRRAELLRLHCRLVATCCEPDRHPERAGWQARLVELLGQGVRPAVPQRTAMVGNGVEMRFAWVPPGTFFMGSPPGEEGRGDAETQHRVTLKKGFYLGVYPVTQAQWQAVMGSNPSHFQGHDRPLEQVSWDDCQEFCKRLSQKVGQRFRLPTEAEWEYACRAGTTTPFFFGETISTDQANYSGNDTYGNGQKGVNRGQTTPMGSFPPNAWGVYDMHGNVLEWCRDWYGPYRKEDKKGHQLSNKGETRVLRGGSWCSVPGGCRSAFRGRDRPGYRYGYIGCRLLLCLD